MYTQGLLHMYTQGLRAESDMYCPVASFDPPTQSGICNIGNLPDIYA